MQTIGGLGLLAALVICYMLYFHSQDQSGDSTAMESRPIAVAPARPGDYRTASSTSTPPSAYKHDLDRAHAAARQMQAEHAEADSY